MKSRAVLVIFWMVSFSSSAVADIYSFTDDIGVTHFTNVPRPGDKRFQLVLRTPPAGVAASGANKAPARNFEPGKYASVIEDAARTYQIDTALIHAVIAVESAYDPNAVSSKGATGLMQLMPTTAKRYGVTDPLDPVQNVHGGTRYLRDLLIMFNRDLELALAAYNAGENAVVRYGNRIPPYRETAAYVPKVLHQYRVFRGRI
jgi:soluble lytic murein transglycosylase-like protein